MRDTRIRSRAEWGARPPRSRTPLTRPAGTVVHWNGPGVGAYIPDRVPELLRGIQAYHMDRHGWADIAYSAVVDRFGRVWEGRGPGTRTAANGTAAANDAHLAVCYLGGEGDQFGADAADGIVAAAEWLGAPKLTAHRDHTATACPGDEITAWARTRRLPSADPPTPTPTERTRPLTAEQAQMLRDLHAWMSEQGKPMFGAIAKLLEDLPPYLGRLAEAIEHLAGRP